MQLSLATRARTKSNILAYFIADNLLIIARSESRFRVHQLLHYNFSVCSSLEKITGNLAIPNT